MDYKVQHNFRSHAPKNAEVSHALDVLTISFTELAEHLAMSLPEGREKSLAITNLEQASMWSKAAVARNQDIYE